MREFFPGDFQHWFAAGGEAIPFGRSLTYRFAQGAFWSALAMAGVEALPWGRVKGLLLRHLRWWVQQPVFTESGLLTIGYAYPNLTMAEDYNAPGSPYWAFEAFLPLALDEEHPFWTASEEDPPELHGPLDLPHASMVVTSRPEKADVIALNAGQRCNDWPRHAFRLRTGPRDMFGASRLVRVVGSGRVPRGIRPTSGGQQPLAVSAVRDAGSSLQIAVGSALAGLSAMFGRKG